MIIEIVKSYKVLYVFKDEKQSYGLCIPINDFLLNKGSLYNCEFRGNTIVLLYDLTDDIVLGDIILAYENYPSTIEEINKKLEWYKKLKV